MEKTKLWIGISCAVVFFLFVGVLIGMEDESPVERIGSQLVYDRIDAITNCNDLQSEFDRAYDNVEARQPGDRLREISAAYGNYADKRMRALGCY